MSDAGREDVDLVTGLCEFSLLYVLCSGRGGGWGGSFDNTLAAASHTHTENESHRGKKHTLPRTPQFLGTKQSQAGF